MPGGLHAPISVMLAWPPPNYDNPETLGNGLLVSSLVLGITATILVGARLYTRAFVLRQPGADDILVVVGLIFAILLSISVIYADHRGWIGRHVWDLHLEDGPPLRFVSWLSGWAVVLASSFTKSSILLFYLRLAPPVSTSLISFRTFVFLGLLYNILYCVSFLLVLLLSCRPLHMYWDQYSVANYIKNAPHHCASDAISLPSSAALSVFGDAYATILPLFLLKGLRIPLKQKIALYALFGLGFLVVGAGIVRTVYIDQVESRTYDITWATWKMWLWTIIETYTAIICSCAPALKPLFVRYVPVPSISMTRLTLSPSQLPGSQMSGSRKSGVGGIRVSWASTARKSRASYLGSPATVMAFPGSGATGASGAPSIRLSTNTPPLSPLRPTFQPTQSSKSVDLLEYVGSKGLKSAGMSVKSVESSRSGLSQVQTQTHAPAREVSPMDEWPGDKSRGSGEDEEGGGIGQAM